MALCFAVLAIVIALLLLTDLGGAGVFALFFIGCMLMMGVMMWMMMGTGGRGGDRG